MTAPDPVELTAELIRCPSITPDAREAIAVVEAQLEPLGFRCTRISRNGVENLYARWGDGDPVFAFAGHVDVVPPGDTKAWTHDPFAGEIVDGTLWGRGATDMKSGVAAMVAAAARFVSETPPDGSVTLIITGDEEGDATDGTVAILDWMEQQGEVADFCIVGEPSSMANLGDNIKIGRRGSTTGYLTIEGRQGHTAYPDQAENPLPALARICARLADTPLDTGSQHFQASTLALTTIDVGNPANNVIPQAGRAVFNVRFNDLHTSDEIAIWAEQIIADEIEETGLTATLDWRVSGESFLTPPGGFTELVAEVLADRGLDRPAMTTGGGTSDARFIKDLCPVVEVGLVGAHMHQVDERVPVEEIRELAEIYLEILRRFFQN